MATIVTRIGKGEALTFAEGDANFINLNNDKIEALVDDPNPQLASSLNANNKNINGVNAINSGSNPVLDISAPLGLALGAEQVNLSGNILRSVATESIELVSQGDVFIELAGGAVEFDFSAFNLGDEQNPFLLGILSAGGNFPNMAVTADFLALSSSDQQTQILINQGGSGDIEINPQNATVANSLKYNEVIHDLGTTDTPTIDVANGNVQTVTIANGLLLPEFDNAIAGQSVTLLVTGSGEVTGTGPQLFAGGENTLTNLSVVSIFYDGAIYWTSISTDFQA